MDLSETLQCRICNVFYNTTTNIPLLLPCSTNHTMCSSCIKDSLAQNKPFLCPWDREKLNLPNQELSAFITNSEMLDCVQNSPIIPPIDSSKLCKTHQKELDMYCLTCKVKVCYLCKHEEEHMMHTDNVDFSSNIAAQVDSIICNIEKQAAEADDLLEKKGIAVQQKKEELLMEVNSIYQKFIGDIQEQQLIQTESIEAYFQQKYASSNEGQKDTNFVKSLKSIIKKIRGEKEEELEPKEEHKNEGHEREEEQKDQIIEDKPKEQNQEDLETLKCSLFGEMTGSKIADIKDWLQTKRRENSQTDQKLKTLTLIFNQEIVQTFKEVPIVLFDSQSHNNVPTPLKHQQNKVNSNFKHAEPSNDI